MKYLSFLLFFCAQGLMAQNPTWFETGTSWSYNYQIWGPIFGETRIATFEITEEVELNGQLCAKMEVVGEPENPFVCMSAAPNYYFYTSNDSVFYATDYDSIFRLAYNFNAGQGDTWEFSTPVEVPGEGEAPVDTFLVTVLSVSNAEIGGQMRKVMELEYENISTVMTSSPQFFEATAYEQVGAMETFFIPFPQSGYDWVCDGEILVVLQCFESPSLSYVNPEFGSCVLSSVDRNRELALDIFPNPSNGRFNIGNSYNETRQFRILTLSGQEVYTAAVLPGISEINVEGLASGMYLLQTQSIDGQRTGKLVIE